MPKNIRNDSKIQVLQRQGCLNRHPQDVSHPLFQESDFFDPRDLVQVKYEMLRHVSVENASVRQSARAFGFSRPTFYQAKLAFDQDGLPGLVPHKRGPRSAHKLTPEVMGFIDQTLAERPSLRLCELAQAIERRFGVVVHPRSIERRLRRQKKR